MKPHKVHLSSPYFWRWGGVGSNNNVNCHFPSQQLLFPFWMLIVNSFQFSCFAYLHCIVARKWLATWALVSLQLWASIKIPNGLPIFISFLKMLGRKYSKKWAKICLAQLIFFAFFFSSLDFDLFYFFFLLSSLKKKLEFCFKKCNIS